MTLTRAKDKYLSKMGYGDLLQWEELFINQFADCIYGNDYQRLLKDALCNRNQLINVYVRLSSIVNEKDWSDDEIKHLSELFTFSYNMPPFKTLSHLEFLEWVVDEMTKFLSEEGIAINGIRESCISNPASAVSEPLCLASFGLYEFEEWQFTLSCREDRFSRKSFRNRLATIKRIELNAFVSIQVRIQQFVEMEELHSCFQRTVARCCAESDHQAEYLDKNPIEFLQWVKAQMESME